MSASNTPSPTATPTQSPPTSPYGSFSQSPNVYPPYNPPYNPSYNPPYNAAYNPPYNPPYNAAYTPPTSSASTTQGAGYNSYGSGYGSQYGASSQAAMQQNTPTGYGYNQQQPAGPNPSTSSASTGKSAYGGSAQQPQSGSASLNPSSLSSGSSSTGSFSGIPSSGPSSTGSFSGIPPSSGPSSTSSFSGIPSSSGSSSTGSFSAIPSSSSSSSSGPSSSGPGSSISGSSAASSTQSPATSASYSYYGSGTQSQNSGQSSPPHSSSQAKSQSPPPPASPTSQSAANSRPQSQSPPLPMSQSQPPAQPIAQPPSQPRSQQTATNQPQPGSSDRLDSLIQALQADSVSSVEWRDSYMPSNSENALVSLLHSVRQSRRITTLDLSTCRFSPVCWRYLVETIRTHPSIRSLRLADTRPAPDALALLIDALRVSGVAILDLARCQLGDAGLSVLVDLWKPINAASESQTMPNRPQKCTVSHLMLSRNEITDDGICILAVSLCSNDNSVRYIDLYENNGCGKRASQAVRGLKLIRPHIDIRYQGPPFESPDQPPPAPLPEEVDVIEEKQPEKPSELDEDEVMVLVTLQEFDANPHSFQVGQKFIHVLNLVSTLGMSRHDEYTSFSNMKPCLKAIYQRFPTFRAVLEGPAKSDFPVAPKVPPLGQSRLRMVELFSVLIDLRMHIFDQKIAEQNVLFTSMNLFFQYPNNNFLHHAIQNMIVAILRGGCTILRAQLFEKCNLVNRILDAFDENDRYSVNRRNSRRPYMGHLIRICNALQKSSFIQPYIREHLEGISRWKSFCMGRLASINERESRPLGEGMPQRPLQQVAIRNSVAEFPADPYAA
eukprot:TRINITY_DN3177_c0_g1_i4.p1 TRINITY_DN3177_c0_g1~~TRINITY_DN3177_c0_g1_i4.p1  ORF type:complete len:836 (+),score=160.03 TRINITY_DN3177_c0_g1_i4:193-2700(+)